MSEEKSPGFRFSMDAESPDAALQDDMQVIRLDRLSRRLTLLAILFPILIAIVLYFAYTDLKKSLSQQETAGSQTVQSLSKDLETLFDDLNTRLTEIEGQFTKQAEEATKNLEAVKFRVYKAENRIKKINASKADKKEQAAALKNINQANKQIEALDAVFAKKLTDLVAIIDKEKEELVKLRSDISTLVVDKIDRKAFDEQFEQEKFNQQKSMTLLRTELGVLRTDLIKRITNFDKKMKDLDALTQSLSTELDKLSIKVSGTSAAPRPAPAAKPPAAKPSGGIIEKDLS